MQCPYCKKDMEGECEYSPNKDDILASWYCDCCGTIFEGQLTPWKEGLVRCEHDKAVHER